MAEMSRLENQLSQLTEQLTKLNITTKEQFKQSKLGSNYNPFSSSFAAPAYSPSMYLDGNGFDVVQFNKIRGRYNPFTHNRSDDRSIEASSLIYASPYDRIRSDTSRVSSAGRLASGLAEGGSGIYGASVGSAAGQIVGASIASNIGGKMGAALSFALPGVGLFAGAALGGTLGTAAFKVASGGDQRVAANSIHKYMMENSYRFLNPNQSSGTTNPLGAGFGRQESRELSRSIALLTDDTNLNVKTLMDLTKSFSEGNLMKGVNTTKEFTKKFKDLTETAKSMAYLLNDSVEDAGKFMSDLQLRGFDMSKLSTQTAKMKNLSQFLGKDVSEVTQTAVQNASNNVAGTNMSFTTSLNNETYNAQVMNRIQDSFLKQGDKSYEAAYDLINNMNGPQEAANVFGRMMNSALVSDNSMYDQAMMASATYDAESQSWSFDSNKFARFNDLNLSLNDGQSYAQNEIIKEYVGEMRKIDPNFEATPDLVYNEYFSNKQRIVGSMESKDQGFMLQALIDRMRAEYPEQLANVSDKAVLKNSPLQFDETSAELAVAFMRASTEEFSNQYDNNGRTAEYIARQKANDTGLVGDIKRFGAGVGNAVAGFGMAITAPIQDVADSLVKKGSDLLFGNKDFNYQRDFGVDIETLKTYFGDSSGYVDPSKLGKNFYKEFEKSLLDEQKKGVVISQVLFDQVSMLAKSSVKEASAEQVLSGDDYRVQRWVSDEGLGDYAKKNYDYIQQLAIDNEISDQTLAYIGQTRNMDAGQLAVAASELGRLNKDYGGNENFVIAAYERGKSNLDKALLNDLGIDMEKYRESGDFTGFNKNEDVREWSLGYLSEMEKSAGVSSSQWRGTDLTVQSKSEASVVEKEEYSAISRMAGAIELNAAGLPSSSEVTLDARLEAMGIEFSPDMSKAEKEALLSVSEEAYKSNIGGLKSYLNTGYNKAFGSLSEDEKTQTLNAYLSKMAGSENISDKELRDLGIIRDNFDKIVKGEAWGDPSVVQSSFGTVNPGAVKSGYDDINSATIKSLVDDAAAEDERLIKQVKWQKENFDVWMQKLDIEGASTEETADARRRVTSAIHAGDVDQIDELGKEFGLSDVQINEFKRQAGLEYGKTGINMLTLDLDSVEGSNAERATMTAKSIEYNYAAAKSLLNDLGFSQEYIDSISIDPDKFDTTGIGAIEASKKALIERAVSALSSMDENRLNEVIDGGLFSDNELAALTAGEGEGKNLLKVNPDGSFSYNTAEMSAQEVASKVAYYAVDQYDPLSGQEQTQTKEQDTKDGLEGAASDLIIAAENTTKVMIDGAKIWVDGQKELAAIMGVPLPTSTSSSSSSTGMGGYGSGNQRGTG